MLRNLFVFHGVDHKVGTTMLTQSIAKLIADENREIRILQISLNGREGAEYVRETPPCIDTLKISIDNKMINGSDFLRLCKQKENYYMLAGITNELEERFYYPETAEYLLQEVAPEFDLILADSGNEIDNGLAIGALCLSENNFLVLTQQETTMKRYERMRRIYAGLNINFPHLIVNKYNQEDPYHLNYIAQRLEIESQAFYTVQSAGYARQAEMDYKTLIEYKNDKYARDILHIANDILGKSGLYEIKKRKSKWKSFI